MNGILKLSWANVWSALVYGLMWGTLAVFVRVSEIGNIFALDWKDLLNIFVMSGIAVGITLVKNLLTTNSGNFVGVVKVIPPIK